jgi:BirA family biotin operon repressor/biotin-[acetyl-CoA-carboxylase] ligase
VSLVDLWEGDTPAAWGARWGVPRLEIHDVVGSTNDRARALADAGAEPFTVVIAEQQTAGRGREGRRWESPAGAGLWLSLVAPPREPTARTLVPIRVGLAACRAIEGAAPGVSAGLKWPNDVQVAGRKVAGVLCESTPTGVVIGVGINVRSGGLSEPVAKSAVALETAASASVDRGALAGRLLAELRALLAADALGLEGDLAVEVDARDVLKGRRVIVADGNEGVARGIGRDGALRLEVRPGEVRRVVAGGVRIPEG